MSARAASVTLDVRELDELRQTLFYSASSTRRWHTVDVKETSLDAFFFFKHWSMKKRLSGATGCGNQAAHLDTNANISFG